MPSFHAHAHLTLSQQTAQLAFALLQHHISQQCLCDGVAEWWWRWSGWCVRSGGTTTLVPFACQHRGGARIRDVVRDYRQLAAKAACDYALHVIVADPAAPHAVADLTELFASGYSSVKVYMTYDSLKLEDGRRQRQQQQQPSPSPIYVCLSVSRSPCRGGWPGCPRVQGSCWTCWTCAAATARW
eukprot:COSAG01_NODE_12695_length_1698_cov_7.378361_2_plen_185_part_00